MTQEEERVSFNSAAGVQVSKNTLITILVCTGLSMFFLNAGVLSLFFLVPIGYAAKATGVYFFTFIIASVSNIIISLTTGLLFYSSSGMVIELLYFSVLFLCFLWIIGSKTIRNMNKFILASAAGAVIFLILIGNMNIFAKINDFIASDNVSVSEDTAFNALMFELKEIITPEVVQNAQNSVYRGGALIFHFILFYFSRQLTHGIYWLIKKQRNDKGLMEFFAPANTIWVLLGSFAYVASLSKIIKNELLDIAVWNILVICCIIFLAQGAGTIIYWLSGKSQFFRLAVNVLIVILIFSPIVIFIVGAVLLLGIAGNFWQFRVQKTGQVSTPEP